MLTLPLRRPLPVLMALLLPLLAACRTGAPESPPDPSVLAHVDPLIGTAPGTTPGAIRHSEAGNEPKGQTFPAVGVPFGMTHWTPQTRAYETKCVVPYYYEDDRLQGFRGSHWWSGSCTQDYGSMTVMPVPGTLQTDAAARSARFSHEDETATPAYYRVVLDEAGVEAEVTGTARSGLLRFTFREAGTAFVILTPNSDEGEGSVEIDPDAREVAGTNPVHRIYQGWGEPAGFGGHFAAVFDTPVDTFGVWRGDERMPGRTAVRAPGDSVEVGAFVGFEVEAGDVVQVKVGTSFTGVDGARANREAEIPGWSFEDVRAEAEAAWEDALGKVALRSDQTREKTKFYTALYHSMLLPRTFSDVDGAYPGFAGGPVRQTRDFVYYDDFSVWDTYRALHPLLTLLEPDRSRDMVRSLVAKGEQGGWLPIFPGWNSYTAAMIGDHVSSIITDAYMKGIRGFDVEAAYRLMLRNATQTPAREEYVDGKGRRALTSYLTYGYVPEEDTVAEAFHRREQVSRTLEYAYDDYMLALLAGALGHEEEAAAFRARAANYRNVFDPSVGFVRGRHADGSWAAAFAPDERQPYITEGTPWHYTWYVPHDVQGLIELVGGREAFVQKLDTLFVRGLYWHGNEPGHQIPYLYAYAGAPWKTQQRVRDILDEEYGTGPGGLSGNDDAGQMSAWYVFGALGFYPVAPGMPVYVLGSPVFEEASLRFDDGAIFTVRAENASPQNRYIQSATLDGRPFDRPWLSHQEILSGGTLRLVMGPTPEPGWGSAPEVAPPSMSTHDAPAPDVP